MLYICIPAHNEAQTIGVLLWRIRKVFQGFSREYEILVYDDGSTDGTAETLAPYAEVAPLAIMRSETRKGYGTALEALVKEASRRTRYPRRDAMVVMQADFTDQPEQLAEMIKRFEGGADVVVGERSSIAEPSPVRRLRQLAGWALRFSLSVGGVADPFASYRLFRISLLREAIKASAEKSLLTSDGWAANVELLMITLPLARRVEKVTVEPRYDLRPRQSRVSPFRDALAVYRFGRSMSGRKVGLPATPVVLEGGVPGERNSSRRERVQS